MSGTDSPVDRWLEPLADAPSGADLVYDPAFLEFTQAAAGKPETQFAAAEPPAWLQVLELAPPLFERTRDLRVALPWARARLNTGGLVELPEGLRLLTGLLARFWDTLHPGLDPDDGDPFERLSVLGALAQLDGVLGDARNTPLLPVRSMGGLRARDIEALLDRIPLRADDTPVSLGHVQGVLSDHPAENERLRTAMAAALDEVKALQRVMNDRFGIERAVDLKPLRGLVEAVQSVLPEPAPAADVDASADAADTPAVFAGDEGASAPAAPAAARVPRRVGGVGGMSVETREDALKAIGLICAYLERAEPTNPAQLLLRRAERLIGRNFLELIRELAPDAVNEVARVMGVDPETIQRPDY